MKVGYELPLTHPSHQQTLPNTSFSFSSLWPQGIALGVSLFRTSPPPGLDAGPHFLQCLALHIPHSRLYLYSLFIGSFPWVYKHLWKTHQIRQPTLDRVFLSGPQVHSLVSCWVFWKTVLLYSVLHLLSHHFLSPLPSALSFHCRLWEASPGPLNCSIQWSFFSLYQLHHLLIW